MEAFKLILGAYLRLGRRKRLSTVMVLIVHGHETVGFHYDRCPEVVCVFARTSFSSTTTAPLHII